MFCRHSIPQTISVPIVDSDWILHVSGIPWRNDQACGSVHITFTDCIIANFPNTFISMNDIADRGGDIIVGRCFDDVAFINADVSIATPAEITEV